MSILSPHADSSSPQKLAYDYGVLDDGHRASVGEPHLGGVMERRVTLLEAVGEIQIGGLAS